MKKLCSLLLLSFIIFNFSCSSSDDSNDDNPPNGQNPNDPIGFTFQGTFYALENAYLSYLDSGPTGTSISLFLVNRDVLENCQQFGVNFIRLQFATSNSDVLLEPGTYNEMTDDFFDYSGLLDADYDADCLLTDFNPFLNDAIIGLRANGITITVNSISDDMIDLTFNIIREDGSIINGTYSGSLEDVTDVNSSNSIEEQLQGEWTLVSIENQGVDVNVIDCQTQQTVTYNANNTGSEFFPEEISQTPCEFGTISFNWQLDGNLITTTVDQEGTNISEILDISTNQLRTVVIERDGVPVPLNQREIFTYQR